MSVFWIVVSVMYASISVAAIGKTLKEGLRNPEVGMFGLCAGCVASVLWLPTLVVFAVWHELLRRKTIGRQL